MTPFYHEQSLTATIITQSPYIAAYLYFFVLLKLNPDPTRLLRCLFVVWAMAVFVFFANAVTFPHNIFGTPILSDLSRGFVRVRPHFLQLFVLFLFYGVSRWQLTKSRFWLVIAIVSYLMVVLSLTRQTIAFSTILVFFQLLEKYSWTKKIVLGSVLAILGALVVVNLPMYQTMKQITEEQIDYNEEKEDVRLGAWRYYSFEGNDHVETFLFGNGIPSLGKSVWGKQHEAFVDETNYNVGDVAWAACIFHYGIIATVALLVVILSSIFKHKPPSKRFLTYFMISEALHGIAWGVFFYHYDVLIIVIALYLIYGGTLHEHNIAEEPVSEGLSNAKDRRCFVIR